MSATTARSPSRESDSPQPWAVAAERTPRPAPGLDWLAARQAAARSRLVQAGLPEAGEEDWRYTSLTAFNRRWTGYLADAAAGATTDTGEIPTPRPTAGSGIRVDVVDGMVRSPASASVPGLAIGSLRQLTPALRTRADGFLHAAETDPDRLVDLNTALLRDGVVIVTEDGVCPPEAIHVQLSTAAPGVLGQPRLLIDIAPDSRVTLILEHSGASGALVNAVTQVRVGRGGELNLIRVQGLPDDGMLLETTVLELGEAAAATITTVDLGGQFSRQSVTVRLAGTGSEATVNGLFLADGKRHIDNRMLLLHQAPATTSRQYFRGIADDHGRGVFNGKIVVREGAAGSNASLTNRNLLLAPTAEIDTKPELEIYVDDVRCSHGATTGQLDAAALFYLRSRGLDPAIARQLLTSAFLREGLGAIALPELRARLDARLQARLGGEPAAVPAGDAG